MQISYFAYRNGSVVVVFTIVIISPKNSVPTNTDVTGLLTATLITADGAQVSVLGAFRLQANSIIIIAAVTVPSRKFLCMSIAYLCLWHDKL